jgi:uncharacterized membrane protein
VDEYSEKFTADFLLLSIGCIAVSGGLEVAWSVDEIDW